MSSTTDTPPVTPRKNRPILLLIPVLFTLGIVAFFVLLGPAGIFPGQFPPVEDVTVGRVNLTPGQIEMVVTNGGPSPVRIAQILVDDAYWDFSSNVDGPLERLKSAKIKIPYPWVNGEPINITLVSSTGLTFNHVIAVATETPVVDGRFLTTFALIGIYIGLIPVLVGMTWKPFLAGLSDRWLTFFLAITAGVLIFLFFDALEGALTGAPKLPRATGGIGVVVLGVVGAFIVTYLAAKKFRFKPGADQKVVVATTVAVGIGIHNMGEGLAVGAAYRLGEIALGTFLVIGFALHNTTEGLGIVSILGDRKTSIPLLLGLGAIAGVPTVFGAWAGAFFFSPTLSTVFLAIAAGAVAQVVIEVLGLVKKRSEGGLTSVESLAGVAIGLAIMYATAIFVAA